MRILLLGLLASCHAVALAQAVEPGVGQRERIARERAAVNARFDAAQRECQTRFVVVPCVNEAKSERRVALERLAKEQAVLDDADRRQRAAERTRRIQDKTRGAESQVPAPPVQSRVRTPPAPRPVASGVARKAAAASAAETPASDTAATQGQSATKPKGESAADAKRRLERVKAQEQRSAQAAEHRAAVEEHNARRAETKPPAAPLPAPSAEKKP